MKVTFLKIVFLVFFGIFPIPTIVGQTKTVEIRQEKYIEMVNASLRETSLVFPRRVEMRMGNYENAEGRSYTLVSEYFSEDNWKQVHRSSGHNGSQTFELRHIGNANYCKVDDGDWIKDGTQCRPKNLTVDAPASDKMRYENIEIARSFSTLNIYAQYRAYPDTVEKPGITPSHFFRDKIWINNDGTTQHREILYQRKGANLKVVEAQSITASYSYGIGISPVEAPLIVGRNVEKKP